jgi:hypothetical protein
MFFYKSKIFPVISLIGMISLISLLPFQVSLIAVISSTLILSLYHFSQNHDINVKYWFSFIGQLLGLIFFVGSFVLLFIMGANLIVL